MSPCADASCPQVEGIGIVGHQAHCLGQIRSGAREIPLVDFYDRALNVCARVVTFQLDGLIQTSCAAAKFFLSMNAWA